MYAPHLARLNAPVLEMMNGGEYSEGQCINIARNYYDHDETNNINYTGMPFETFGTFFLYVIIAYATICFVIPLEHLFNNRMGSRKVWPLLERKQLFDKSSTRFKRLRTVPQRLLVI